MRPIEAIALGQSARGVTDLVILLGILALNFVAVAKIITKAGYSPRWIWVPLTPVCLWFFTLILLAVDVRTIVLGRDATVSLPVSLGNFALLQVVDVLSVIVTWVFFLIFAFSTWPVSLARREARSFEGSPDHVRAGGPVSGRRSGPDAGHSRERGCHHDARPLASRPGLGPDAATSLGRKVADHLLQLVRESAGERCGGHSPLRFIGSTGRLLHELRDTARLGRAQLHLLWDAGDQRVALVAGSAPPIVSNVLVPMPAAGEETPWAVCSSGASKRHEETSPAPSGRAQTARCRKQAGMNVGSFTGASCCRRVRDTRRGDGAPYMNLSTNKWSRRTALSLLVSACVFPIAVVCPTTSGALTSSNSASQLLQTAIASATQHGIRARERPLLLREQNRRSC